MWPFKKKKTAKKQGKNPAKESIDPRLRELAAASLKGKFAAWRPRYETLLGDLRSNNLSLIRKRCRESAVNSPVISALVGEISTFVVGPGINVEFRHSTKSHAKRANELWDSWVESRDFSADGELDFYQMQKLVMEEIAVAGEVFIKRSYKAGIDPSREVGLEYQLCPADQLADNLTLGSGMSKPPEGAPEDAKYIDGIGYNKKGRKLGYIFYEDDYSQKNLLNYFSFSSAKRTFIPADEVHHVYNRKEIRFRRGWPLIGTAIIYGHLGKLLDESQLTKQIVAAMFAAFVHDNSAEVSLEATTDNNEGDFDYDSEIQSGTIYNLPTGKDVTFSDAPQNTDYESFDKGILRKIAGTTGVPYESLASNHSDANYSAARQSQLNADRRMVKLKEDILIKQFIMPLIDDFKNYLKAMSLLPTESLEYDIFTPGKILIDPAKEIKPKADEVRAGFKAWSEAIRERGKNPRKVAERIAEDYKLFDDLGIKIDTDIRMKQAMEAKPNGNNPQPSPQGDQGK